MDTGRNGNGGDIIGGSAFCSDRYSYLIKVRIQKSLPWSSKLMSHGVKSHRPLTDPLEKFIVKTYNPVDTGRKLNVRKTFRRRSGRKLNILCTFNLRPVSTGCIQGWVTIDFFHIYNYWSDNHNFVQSDYCKFFRLRVIHRYSDLGKAKVLTGPFYWKPM